MPELLTPSLKFPDLRVVKIEADHPVPGFDSFVAKLDEQCLSS